MLKCLIKYRNCLDHSAVARKDSLQHHIIVWLQAHGLDQEIDVTQQPLGQSQKRRRSFGPVVKNSGLDLPIEVPADVFGHESYAMSFERSI